jgi:tetratricopeptide (TPR) repeat protein
MRPFLLAVGLLGIVTGGARAEPRTPPGIGPLARAYVLTPTPTLLYRLAQAHERAGLHREAVHMYERLAQEEPVGSLASATATALLRLRPRLPEQSAAELIRQRLDWALWHFHHDRYDAAIELYETTYALRRLPRILFNIAQAERRAQNPEEALRMYERYLEEAPPAVPLKSEARFYMRELRGQLEAQQRVRRPPLHRRAWFWATLSAAAAAAGTGLALGLALRPQDEYIIEPQFPPRM